MYQLYRRGSINANQPQIIQCILYVQCLFVVKDERLVRLKVSAKITRFIKYGHHNTFRLMMLEGM